MITVAHAGFGITYMYVRDGSPFAGAFNAIARDVLRRDRVIGMPGLIIVAATDGAGEYDFV